MPRITERFDAVAATSKEVEKLEAIVEAPGLADALESERFKRFLDHVPIAIAVSELRDPEVIVYANTEFERVSGLGVADLERQSWEILSGSSLGKKDGVPIASAIVENSGSVGVFEFPGTDCPVCVELHSNLIEDDFGVPVYRLVALVDGASSDPNPDSLIARVREKDTQLRELQHRVKNNLQMITALIRLETRNAVAGSHEGYTRLAGRVASLALLYDTLSLSDEDAEIDLGAYLGQIATAVMATHAVDGIKLDLVVESYMVSINVAMPTGLVVNELLTNSLKHAFRSMDSGTITLHCKADDEGVTVKVSDDGVGLPDGETWPKPGRLGALIVHSLRENTNATVEVTSGSSTGTEVAIRFTRASG
jgi:two-component sensor histidine kinase